MCRISAAFLAILTALLMTARPASAQGDPAAQPGGEAEQAMRAMLAEGPKGSLAVQVIQGTKGGPAVGEIPVIVDLYHQNKPVWQMTADLDAAGNALIADVPVALAVRPVVRVEYSGVSYLEIGPQIDQQHPDGTLKLTVYLTTLEEPEWHVAMRHIMVQRVTDGTLVNETLVVENPSDSTWFGGQPMREGKGTTLRVGLPKLVTAENVHLDSGFHGWCCTTYQDGELAVQMPMMPGQTPFKYTYFIPTQPEQVALEFSASAPTDSVVVFVPDDGTDTEIQNLTLQGSQKMGQQSMRSYSATKLEAGQQAEVVLTSLRSAAEVGNPGAAADKQFPWVVVGGIGTLVVVAIVGVIAVRGRGG